MAGTNTTLRRRQLANRLRKLRQDASMTVEEAAGELLCSAAKISRMETGQRGASPRDVRDLCRIYGVADEKLISQLMTMARESRQPGLKQEWGDLGDDDLYLYMELEATASAITELQTAHLPALFQTQAYAAALIRGLLPNITQDVLNRRVEARLKRQELLDTDNAPRYWTFIDEAALHRVVGDRTTMAEQFDKLLTRAQAPHVTVQVIPFSVGPYMCADNPFVFFKLRNQSPSEMVYRESLDRVEYLEKQSELEIYHEAVDRIRAVALPPSESLKRISAAISDISTS